MKVAQKPLTDVGIAEVERDTGLSKDILRVWERRYGFPRPLRDAHGERSYPPEQVDRLRLIRRLMNHGLRPGQIVGEPMRELRARIASLPGAADRVADSEHAAVLNLLRAHDVAGLHRQLERLLVRLGLARFVADVVAPLNTLVGNAWARGQLAVFEEHLYSEQVQQLLQQALATISPVYDAVTDAPRILLTTLPGEEHQLGLLMARVCMATEGASCVSLGVQTPLADIVRAARAHRADVVALSFSSAQPLRAARAAVQNLRGRLDRKVDLWVGGSIWAKSTGLPTGVHALATLEAIAPALAVWRAREASVPAA